MTLIRFAISGGIGPVNWFSPKSKTWRYFNIPSSLGIIPIRLLPCKILQNIKNTEKKEALNTKHTYHYSKKKRKRKSKETYSCCKNLIWPNSGARNPLKEYPVMFLQKTEFQQINGQTWFTDKMHLHINYASGSYFRKTITYLILKFDREKIDGSYLTSLQHGLQQKSRKCQTNHKDLHLRHSNWTKPYVGLHI